MLKNQKILITGVGKGIGREIFRGFKEGAFVIGVTRSKKDFKEFSHFRVNINFSQVIFHDRRPQKKFLIILKKNRIKLTGLVNNAGIRQRKKFEKKVKRLKKNYGK